MGFVHGMALLEDGQVGRGLALIQESAADNDPRALKFLVQEYERGDLVQPDATLRFRCLRKLADLNDVDATFRVAVCYRSGLGTARDDRYFLHYLTRAAKADHGAAQNELALLYAAGQLVPQDLEVALTWLVKARRNGNKDAERNIAIVLYSINFLDRHIRRARISRRLKAQ